MTSEELDNILLKAIEECWHIKNYEKSLWGVYKNKEDRMYLIFKNNGHLISLKMDTYEKEATPSKEVFDKFKEYATLYTQIQKL